MAISLIRLADKWANMEFIGFYRGITILKSGMNTFSIHTACSTIDTFGKILIYKSEKSNLPCKFQLWFKSICYQRGFHAQFLLKSKAFKLKQKLIFMIVHILGEDSSALILWRRNMITFALISRKILKMCSVNFSTKWISPPLKEQVKSSPLSKYWRQH